MDLNLITGRKLLIRSDSFQALLEWLMYIRVDV